MDIKANPPESPDSGGFGGFGHIPGAEFSTCAPLDPVPHRRRRPLTRLPATPPTWPRVATPVRLYAVRFRFYDAETFRWLNRDPAGYVDSMNLYGYGFGSGIGWGDPFGLGGPSFATGAYVDGEVIRYDQIKMRGMGWEFRIYHALLGFSDGWLDFWTLGGYTAARDALGWTPDWVQYESGAYRWGYGVGVVGGAALTLGGPLAARYGFGAATFLGTVAEGRSLAYALRVAYLANEIHYTARTAKWILVVHFSSANAIAGIVRTVFWGDSYVTRASAIPRLATAVSIEQRLEIAVGKGEAWVLFYVLKHLLRVPSNGRSTSGGAWQRQTTMPLRLGPTRNGRTDSGPLRLGGGAECR